MAKYFDVQHKTDENTMCLQMDANFLFIASRFEELASYFDSKKADQIQRGFHFSFPSANIIFLTFNRMIFL